ncbi:MAG TPA: LysR family transcriptional regulator [Allosphingosinicella sp.]|uniref:LysR family transcriptional regulator n=1 Tax=Allosphingosinicella sp. TaxID=2823234 RepID=UPI002F27EBCC
MERSAVDIMDVLAFVRVAETGAFARAAERMGISKSIVSRRVARLEEQLGARLLTRTAQGASPTDIGQTYFARAANILAELEAAQEVVADAVTQVAGPIRMTAPISFGTRHLAPALVDFAKRHPKIELDVSLDDKRVDLIAGGFDLAIRIGKLPDSNLRARKLTSVRASVLASPAYLERQGRPEQPQDLNGHDLLYYANLAMSEQFRFKVGDRTEQVTGTVRMRADSGDLLKEAAIAGLGVVQLPNFIASAAIRSGELEVLLRGYPLPEVGLHAVMPPGRAGTARIRAIVDFLAERFGPEPGWDPCWEAEKAWMPDEDSNLD